ncbi:MAG: NAD(P)H-hydrate dehydratase [Eubacterium sp.]|nr:NAD(P)H-hydrate dehydratase [Eubacterium sp.]
MRILTTDQIRKVENLCFERYYNEAELMLKAGNACADSIINRYGDSLVNAEISVLCGGGKNAGDGFVIARRLFAFGARAKIVLCAGEPTIAEPLLYFNQAVKSRVPVVDFADEHTVCDYIVDCMFGIGFHGEARAPFDKIFKTVGESEAEVIAIDTPSGTNSTTGEACENCVCADFTIAISTLKMAHVLPPANAFCGEVETVTIDIPEDCYEDEYVLTVTEEDVKTCFNKRGKNANKGSFGHQLNICGSRTMFGAAVIATKAAVRSGAGLVKLMIPESAYPLAAAHLTQPIFKPVKYNALGTFSSACAADFDEEKDWATSIVLGCGMGVNADTVALCEHILKNATCPIILDADGINCLSQRINMIEGIKAPIVLTPHPGEMARLISKTPAEIQQDRINIAKTFARENNTVLVLKGANTVVTDGQSVFVNTTGNPALAMGGTGDMLAGMIGAFAARGIEPLNAAKAAVYLHGLCGDVAAKKLSQRGAAVSDMTELLGVLMSVCE